MIAVVSELEFKKQHCGKCVKIQLQSNCNLLYQYFLHWNESAIEVPIFWDKEKKLVEKIIGFENAENLKKS